MPMVRTPGLLAYQSLAALNAPTARRRVLAEIARGAAGSERLAERLGQASQVRPKGPLVWLHAASLAQEVAIWDLIRHLGTVLPDAGFLLTSDTAPQRTDLPPRCQHQFVPYEAGGSVASFLDHWRPAAGLWAGNGLRPALIHAAVDCGVPMTLIDAGAEPIGPGGWPRLVGATLRIFDRVLAVDERAAETLRDAGAEAAAIEIAGPLQQEVPTPLFSQRERNALAAALKARPIWLAALVTPAEEDAVIMAQRLAQRLAHRLLLVLVPDDAARGPELARRLGEAGLSVALRSVEGEPDATTEVLVADSDGELGLWYRLAPVTFLGGTLDLAGSGGRSPLEPAALGSAVLHGPGTGPHAATYARFTQAAAARLVTSGSELGEALSDLLSPDRAAAMAHSAWRVSTLGAGVFERIAELIAGALAQRAVP